jgi:hypothetical protein
LATASPTPDLAANRVELPPSREFGRNKITAINHDLVQRPPPAREAGADGALMPPQQYLGASAFQKPWQGFLDMFKGPINAEMNDLVIDSDGKIAHSRRSSASRERRTRASRSIRRFASRMSIARITASG